MKDYIVWYVITIINAIACSIMVTIGNYGIATFNFTTFLLLLFNKPKD